MEDDKKVQKVQYINKVVNNSGSGALYGLGILGALVYYLQHTDSFGTAVLGVIKAIFWPAVIVYEVLNRLGL